jgi:asparagine synthetase B (glutamine-hydrolysing)
MSNEDGTLWIVYNGEIYNHEPLRRELEAKGHRHRSRTDTKTMVHLIQGGGSALCRASRRHVRPGHRGRASQGALPGS